MSKSDQKTLRVLVKEATGQDVRRCGHCAYCVKHTLPDDDLSLESLLQMVLKNDEEVLTSRTLWSEAVLQAAPRMCKSTMDVPAILRALRSEAQRRGLVKDEGSG